MHAGIILTPIIFALSDCNGLCQSLETTSGPCRRPTSIQGSLENLDAGSAQFTPARKGGRGLMAHCRDDGLQRILCDTAQSEVIPQF